MRLWLIPVIALVSVLAPSVVQAQYAVVSPCGGAYRTTYDCARVSVIPAPPTELPAWLQPTPAVPPVYVPPVSAPPQSVYRPPVYVAPPAPRGGGIDPWIPLAIQPARIAQPSDVLSQLLLLEALAARRAQREAAPAPAPAPTPVAPAPTARRAPEKHWMDTWIKPVNPAP